MAVEEAELLAKKQEAVPLEQNTVAKESEDLVLKHDAALEEGQQKEQEAAAFEEGQQNLRRGSRRRKRP